jgi:hypothetical protein
MNNLIKLKKDLEDFGKANKFIDYLQLQPAVANSTTQTKDLVNREMAICCNELILCIDAGSPMDSELKQLVRNSLGRIEDAMLDTEDSEFCYELYHVIGTILGVNIEDESMDMKTKLMNDMLRFFKKEEMNPDDFTPLDNS